MPGASALLDEVDPTVITEAPETVKLWLPSQLPLSVREKFCVQGLPQIEFRLRLAQAYDSLDLIRRLCGVYQVLLAKNQIHISSSQGTMTRTKTLFSNFSLKIDKAAACYRDARAALLRLDPDERFSRWKNDLRELRREDIRGPSREKNEKSRQETSWIWQTASLRDNTGVNDPDLQAIMRAEWCKATARAERFREEVELVVKEMRRTLVFFEWTADNWERLGKARAGEPNMDEDTAAGLEAYAARKSALYRKLINVFHQDWYEGLKLKSLGSDWLSKYTHPTTIRRRRLPSNVAAYHSSPSLDVDNPDDALANDPPSDTEMSTTSVLDIDIDDF